MKMNRYIEVQELQRLIAETGNRHSRNGEDIQTCGSVCADLIISVYQLSVPHKEKIQHGKWEQDEFGSKCSSCGSYAYRDKFGKPWESPYCPICGAKMDKKYDYVSEFNGIE